MFFSNIYNSIKSRLGTKSILISVLLICAISLILSAFFVTRQKKLLMNEHHKRALSLSNTLVFNSQFPFIARDEEQLLKLLEGVKQEDDIVDAFFTTKGTFGGISTINFHSDTSMVGQKIHIPSDFDFNASLRGDWFPSGDGNKMRIVSPVLGLPAEGSVSDEFLFPSPELEGRRDILYGRPFFPCFTADSKEITFSLHRGFVCFDIWKYNIETRSYSKFLESAANGWWSHDGRYFVFNKVNKERDDCDTSILDTKTGEVRVIQKNSKFPQPHFSFDDNYILSTVKNENNGDRIVRIPFEGGTTEQITFHDGSHYWPESSSDGKWILYFNELSNSMYVYNTEKEESSRVFPDFDVYHGAGTFSPDGKKICYIQFSEYYRSKSELFVADFPYVKGSENYGTQITFTGKVKWINPEWSPDGKWIVYPDDEDLFIISPEGGEPIQLTSATPILGFAVLDVSLENMNDAMSAAIWYAAGITLIIIIAGSLGAVHLVRTITVPIHKLAEASGALGKLDFDQKVSVDRTDELGVLAESFNQMIQRLKVSRDEIDAMNRGLEEKVQKRTAELEKSHKELETLDKTKDYFLLLVSHELRAPLSSVLLYSEMFLDGLVESEETRNEFLITIVENCKRLTRLINNVLDLSKIEAGRMPFNVENLNIRTLVEKTHSGVRPNLESHGIHFDYENVDKDVLLRGDRDKIVQVLTNIVSNAIKFTPEGGSISISLSSSGNMSEIAVSDTGKGIKEEDLPKVFDRFTQIESIDHHSGGTGLGMTISKSIIEHLGGKIRIESKVNKGTTVYFTLPKAKNHSESGEKKEAASGT